MQVKNNITYHVLKPVLADIGTGWIHIFISRPPDHLSKTWKKFKFLFFLGVIFLYHPARVGGQQIDLSSTLTIQLEEITFPPLFDSITSITSIKFSYNPELFYNKKPVNINFQDTPLNDVLDSLLKNDSIGFTAVDNHIVFYPLGVHPANALENHQLTIKGKILNDRTGKPVEYANITIPGKQMGTISNQDGEFIFKMPVFHDSATIVVSAIGYANFSAKTSELIDTPARIHLQPIALPIEEVTIYAVDPVSTIRRLIENIKKNYHDNYLLQTAFYRETIKENDAYVGINEAVVKILNPPTLSLANEKISIYKARKSTDVKIMDTIDFKFQGGIYNSLALDVAGESISFLDKSSMHLYDYTYTGLEVEDKRYSFIIEFDQKDGIKEPLYSGKLWVDANTYGLNRAKFSISEQGMYYAKDMLVKKYSRQLKIKPIAVEYHVDYEFTNGKWQLKHVKSELEIKVRKKGTLFGNNFHVIAEMVITESFPVNRKEVKLENKVRATDILSEEIEGYDPKFWGPYNYLQPNESLEKSFEKIRAVVEHTR